MTRPGTSRGGLGSVLLALCVSVTASAQVAPAMAVSDPALESNGIRIGDGRLHPFLDLELRYDSFAGLRSATPGGPATEPFAEFLAHFRPGLKFDLPYPNFDFTIGGEADEVLYTGILDPRDTKGFTRLDYDANLGMGINRPGAVELDINDTLTHSDRTNNAATTVGVVSLYNNVSAAVPIHPGGRALEVAPHGSFTFENFTPIECAGEGVTGTCSDPNNVKVQDYQNINFGLDGRLLFLPKTAFVLQSGVDIRRYPYDPGFKQNPQTQTALLNATVGVSGLLTSRIAVLLRAGYGYDFLATDASTVIGQAEVSFLPNEFTTLKAGFSRLYSPVPTYGTYLDDKPYIDLRTLLAGRLALHLNASYDLLQFSAAKGASASFARTDNVISVDLGPQYEFTRWLIGSLGLIDSYRQSSETGDLSNFNRLEVYARVTFTY